MLRLLIILINFDLIILSLFIYKLYVLKINKRKIALDKLPEIFTIFEKAKELAYSKIFRDHLLTYTTSGYKINKNEIGTFQKLYVKHIFRIVGPNIKEDLLQIYGNDDSICLQLVNEFIQRVEQDETQILRGIIDTGQLDMFENNKERVI